MKDKCEKLILLQTICSNSFIIFHLMSRKILSKLNMDKEKPKLSTKKIQLMKNTFSRSMESNNLIIPFLALSHDGKSAVYKYPESWTKQAAESFDIFQFAVFAVQLLTGQLPQAYGSILKVYTKHGRADGDRFYYDPFDGLELPHFFTAKGVAFRGILESDSSIYFLDILRQCYDLDPTHRPTAKQLLSHFIFNLSKSLIAISKTMTFYFLRSVPVQVFVEGIIGSLVKQVADEFNLGSSVPSLKTAVGSLVAFFQLKCISFPIDDEHKLAVVEEVFAEHIFDKIVEFIVSRLRIQVDLERVDHNEQLDSIVALYEQFFRNCLNNPTVFRKVFDSFKLLITGIDNQNDSHNAFIFLHHNLGPLVEFFFIKIPLRTRNEMNLSRYYSNYILAFYTLPLRQQIPQNIVDYLKAVCIRRTSRYDHQQTIQRRLDVGISKEPKEGVC